MPRKAKNLKAAIPNALLATATARAASQGQTLDDLVADVIRVHLGQPTAADIACLIAAAPLIGADANDANKPPASGALS